MSKTQPARGMRDFLPADVRKRNYVIGVIKQVYESYGFEPLETPSVENLETLMGKYGEEGNQLVFKILKRGEKLDISKGESGLADLALRYDLTVPLARVVANYRNELPKFFKRYQIQPVWRADRPARGRYREFYQCDVDAIGSSSMIVEAELISAANDVFKKLRFRPNDYVVLLNNRKILSGLLDCSGIPVEKHTDALIAMDKRDKIGDQNVLNEMIDRGVARSSSVTLVDFIREWALDSHAMKASNLEVSNFALQKLRVFLSSHTDGLQGVAEVEAILSMLKDSECSAQILVAPSLARGLSYYTGAIFEISVPDLAGSLGGGGRYDGLIGMFGKEQIPACGFSLGLERILVVMEERGMFPPELSNSAADVMVTVWSEESAGESMRLASELRAAGLRVLVYPEAEKLGKQFKYAGQIGVKHVCVLGESEVAEGVVAVKDMATGEQASIARKDIAARLFES